MAVLRRTACQFEHSVGASDFTGDHLADGVILRTGLYDFACFVRCCLMMFFPWKFQNTIIFSDFAFKPRWWHPKSITLLFEKNTASIMITLCHRPFEPKTIYNGYLKWPVCQQFPTFLVPNLHLFWGEGSRGGGKLSNKTRSDVWGEPWFLSIARSLSWTPGDVMIYG